MQGQSRGLFILYGESKIIDIPKDIETFKKYLLVQEVKG